MLHNICMYVNSCHLACQLLIQLLTTLLFLCYLFFLVHSGSSTGAGSCVFFGQRLERFCDSLTEYARSLALKPLGKYSASKSSTTLASDASPHTTTGQLYCYLLTLLFAYTAICLHCIHSIYCNDSHTSIHYFNRIHFSFLY